MDTRKLRKQLIERLKTANESTLRQVDNILSEPEAPDYGVKEHQTVEMSELLERLLEQSLAEADAGKTIPHEEVMRRMREKYPFLKDES